MTREEEEQLAEIEEQVAEAGENVRDALETLREIDRVVTRLEARELAKREEA
jgi:hypothetical protein